MRRVFKVLTVFNTKREYFCYGIISDCRPNEMLCNTERTIPPPTSPIIKELGNAVKAYWAGATMNPFPIPPIPAFAIQNIVVTNNICINPGIGFVPIELPAVLSPNFFIDIFVLSAQIHLLTLKGMIYTTSMYPSNLHQ